MIPLADPTGLAAHACGRALGQAVPMSVRQGFEVGVPLTVSQTIFLLHQGRRVFARLRLVEDRSAPPLVLLNHYAVSFILKTEGDHDATSRFTLDAEGDLILEP
jgi:hypothetical protein